MTITSGQDTATAVSTADTLDRDEVAVPPGHQARRLLRLARASVAECRLDLSGAVVLTEAATGPYAVTPVIAALAGARVIAWTRDTRHGSAAQAVAQTTRLARLAGVQSQITISTTRSERDVSRADIITNSGHVRPIDRAMAAAMKPTAVVPLMFEAWEAQAGRVDMDLAALRERGIQVAGTNERHPAVDVFSYLGLMAVALLRDAGVAAYRSRIAILCDNPFQDYLVRGLRASGAQVWCASHLPDLLAMPESTTTGAVGIAPDALLVSLRPVGAPVLSPSDVRTLAVRWPGCLVAQFWGDLDRETLAAAGLPAWPAVGPGAGHMGVLPAEVGPEPVVRLQAGGLKVGEVLRKPADQRDDADREFLDEL